jgi:tetratricopeptide (TPR) repeat protein
MERRRSVDHHRLMGLRHGWLILLLLLGSGCSLTTGHGQTALSASPAVKREIYREVAATIAERCRQGDAFLRQGDLYRALACYRQAAFYEQTPELREKIANLQIKITEKSKQLVIEGQALLDKDEEAALKTFNRALQLNPDNRTARRARDQLLEKPRFQAELAARQATLYSCWKNHSTQPKEIATLAEQAAAVLAYQSDNPLALKVEKRIDRQRKKDILLHLEKGLDFYQAGKLEKAKFFAQKAQAIDPNNPDVISFLREIRKDQDISYFLNLARYRLEQGDLDKAEEYARKALAVDPDQQAAEAIVQKVQLTHLKNSLARARSCFARREYEGALLHMQRVLKNGPHCNKWPELQEEVQTIMNREIPAVIDHAQKLFAENKLQQANHLLASVVELDPDNHMAATYLKKIQSRLATIESLE